MKNISFDTLNQGWNSIRNSGAKNLRKIVSGFIDPARITLQRIGETPQTLSIQFKGFDKALDQPLKDGPILKRSIIAWIKNFFPQVKIDRSSDSDTLLLNITKNNTESLVSEQNYNKLKEALLTNLPKGDEPIVYISKRKIYNAKKKN
jgi:hypothetical protein